MKKRSSKPEHSASASPTAISGKRKKIPERALEAFQQEQVDITVFGHFHIPYSHNAFYEYNFLGNSREFFIKEFPAHTVEKQTKQ